MASTARSGDAAGRGSLPLFPDMEAASPFRRPVDTRSLFQDPLLRQLIGSRPVQRLRRIGFLGAVDRIQSRNWYTRHDHSVGVARLALLYAKSRSLSQHDTRVLAVAGLLHDVGHGPLSHTLEPIFKDRFGISHHKGRLRDHSWGDLPGARDPRGAGKPWPRSRRGQRHDRGHSQRPACLPFLQSHQSRHDRGCHKMLLLLS